ncbi:hypothetical protein [Pseudoduganella sp.]|uniref:hypothetical protein n=1 Tax=Pseudoduganella sp. TaxID=1880898 RepID=UPI0035B001B5
MQDHIAAIQENLNDFYRAELASLQRCGALAAADMAALSAPFLLNVEAARPYFAAPRRVMFVGQETKGWLCRLPQVLSAPDYRLPALRERYATALHAAPGRSHFLRMKRHLENELCNRARGAVLWTNLFRMDVYRGPGRSRNARNYSDVLTQFSARLFRHELAQLRPRVIILGCSATHDPIVKALFEAPLRQQVRVYEPRKLWHFTYDGMHCFRTVHPAVARFGKGREVHQYYQTIIETIRQAGSTIETEV